MSYCFDELSTAWEQLRAALPPEVRDGEFAVRFGFTLDDLHEANHRAGDVINKDMKFCNSISRLQKARLGRKEES